MKDIGLENGTKTPSVKNRGVASAKFLGFSLTGIILFFAYIPITYGGVIKSQPIFLHGIDWIKATIGVNAGALMTMICASTLVTLLIAKKVDSAPQWLKDHHKKDGIFTAISYALATLFCLMTIFQVGPQSIIGPGAGGLSIKLALGVFAAIILAGSLVTLLVEFGLLEFISKFLEPVMRRVYKIPGTAAIDLLTSFVASPAVGVQVTNMLYKKEVYTEKEASIICTSFSIASLGVYAFLGGIAGVPEYYSTMVLCSLIATFLAGIVVVRIHPLKKKKDVYYSGRVQTEEERISRGYHAGMLGEAYERALVKVEQTNNNIFLKNVYVAIGVSQKVVAYVIALAVIAIVVATKTPIITWLGMPFVPILNLLQIPDASIIAPSTIVGFFALHLPSALIAGKGVAPMAAVFVVVLSVSQIIFFTESGNAMLDSEIPVTFLDLLKLFVIRTVVLYPIVALLVHIFV
jgi:nucleoside recognition membrane protein YjiH